MNNFIGKRKKRKKIWTKKKYAIYTSIISRLETEKIVYIRLINLEQDNEDEQEKKFSLV